jgi:hypothetical protein
MKSPCKLLYHSDQASATYGRRAKRGTWSGTLSELKYSI